MEISSVLLFGLVVMGTHFLEGITGFGCTVLALPFCIALAGITTSVPVLVVLGLVLCLYVVLVDYRHIVWREYFKIVCLVALGLPVGIWIFQNLPEDNLKTLLGVFMILVAVRGLLMAAKPLLKKAEAASWQMAEQCTDESSRQHKKSSWLKRIVLDVLLFGGGIVHGAFSSGGPFVVIYASQALPDKSNFRATLCMLWVTLNSVLVFHNWQAGLMTEAVNSLLLASLPFLAVGMVLGNLAHKHIKSGLFNVLVYGILLISGFFMI